MSVLHNLTRLFDGFIVEFYYKRGGDQMVEETIKSIRDTEEQAEKQVKDADTKCSEILEQASQEAKQLKETTLQEAKAKAEEKLKSAKAEGEAAMKEALLSVESRITSLKEAAGQKEEEAIKAVIAELI